MSFSYIFLAVNVFAAAHSEIETKLKYVDHEKRNLMSVKAGLLPEMKHSIYDVLNRLGV